MIIAFTGAGISAPSGIPTFQAQPGIRDKLTRTYANRCPEEFRKTLDGMLSDCQKAEPNDAHIAIAEAGVPVITMNVDGLHKRAGSQKILQVHGNLFDGNVVLYGDPAPLYSEAESWVYRLGPGDMLLVVGTSYYTGISSRLRQIALSGGADVIEVNDGAETRVRGILDANRSLIESFEDFIKRTDDMIDKAPPMPGPYAGGWEMP